MTNLPRRTALKTLAGAGAFLAFGGVGSVSADDHDDDDRRGASADQTIVDIVVGSDDFDILEAAVLAADPAVLSALSDDEQYTVFAPTDEAFESLLAALGITAEQLLASPDLTDILLYHVTEGRRYAASVVNADEIEMLNDDEVDVDGTELNDGQATIVDTDIEASNGVIHVIDGVLLPPAEEDDEDDDDDDDDDYGDDDDDYGDDDDDYDDDDDDEEEDDD